MQSPGPDSPYGTVTKPPRLDGKTFFGFHLYLAKNVAKIFSARALCNVIWPGQKLVSKRKHLLYRISIQFTSILPVFTDKYFRKKITQGKMLIEQIITFELKGHVGFVDVHVLLQLVIFMKNQKSRRKSLSGFFLQLKYCRRQGILLLFTTKI